jgi:hypothetical protein
MEALYPSQEWADQWKAAINGSSAIAELGKEWGVGFNGNFLFELRPGGGLEEITYIYLEAAGGKCSDARKLTDASGLVPGFTVSGSYADFKPIVKGEKDFIEALLKGTFKMKGDMTKVMRYAKFMRAVANTLSSFKASYLGE